MITEFVVYGEPVAKGRPRFSWNGRPYTPEKTANYEMLVQWEYVRQCGELMFPGTEYIGVTIKAYYGIPKSTSKKRRELMKTAEIRPTKKPDIDNVVKSICDSLNGVAYKDDSQIVRCEADKYYAEQPRVEVILQTISREEG